MGFSNIPLQLTSFIGREREIADITRLLFSSHLVTLMGTGGSGKTRLAIQVANAVSDSFADGVWLIDLAALQEPALVAQLVALGLGLQPIPDQPLIATLLGFIRSKQLLLILDNCEHLREACAQLAQSLLSQAPGLRILATSSVSLAITGETIYPISGLDWPVFDDWAVRDGHSHLDLDRLMGYDAVCLFVERARSILPNFTLTSENVFAIADICRRLDGLPLALELASARVNILTVQEIAARLGDRFALLISAKRTGLVPRHQTLRAAIEWSFVLLTLDEQILLRRLAVFSAGCTLDSAEAVCSGEGIDEKQIVGLLSSLADNSLIITETTGRAQARYRLLETIRAFALEKLEEAGEMARLRERHLYLFLEQVEEAAPKLGEAYQQLWLNWLEGEHDNLRAALSWSLESGRIEAGLRIATALVRFWEIRGYVQEGLSWFQRLLPLAGEEISMLVHANALAYASFLAMFLGDAATTMAYGRKAITLAETAGEEGNNVLIMALAGLASGSRVVGDYTSAFDLEEQMIQLLRETPANPFLLGMALLSHGSVAIELGDYATAGASLDESLAIARDAGDSFRIAHALNVMGDLARCERSYEDAQSLYENSAALLREVDAQHDLASVLHNLGHTCLHLGDIERARTLFAQSMAAHQAVQNVSGMAECLIGFAAIALLNGFPGICARLLGASVGIGQQGNAAGLVWKATRMEYEHYLDRARSRLTEEAFQTEYQAGKVMSLEQAVSCTQKLLLKPETASASRNIPDSLTGRERQVAALIGQGMTNGEIAAELVLSKRTVETHVSNILSKLGLSNRAQIMRWVIDHGLT